MSLGEKIFYAIMILTLVMVNPPVLIWVNNYTKAHPLTGGWPTLWLWLSLWYLIAMIAFAISAWKIDKWNKEF